MLFTQEDEFLHECNINNRYSMPILKLLKGHKSCKKRLLFSWFKSELKIDSDE